MTTPSNPYAELIASCRAFALQCEPFGVAGVLNDAAEAMFQLTRDVEEARAALTEIEARCHMETRQGLLEIVTTALTRLSREEK